MNNSKSINPSFIFAAEKKKEKLGKMRRKTEGRGSGLLLWVITLVILVLKHS